MIFTGPEPRSPLAILDADPHVRIPFGTCHCGCGEPTRLSDTTNRTRGYIKGQPRMYILGHQMVGRVVATPEERFWAKVEKTDTCWNWTAFLYKDGYGRHYVTAERWVPAHRYAYELLVGPIPDGLVLDHLCRNRACVNPAHLEPVTHRENCLRGMRGRMVTHCPQGHEYNEANTYYDRDNHRTCRVCGAESARRRRRERSAS